MPTAEDDFRPRTADGYIGQRLLMEELTIRCKAALAQGRLLEPILLAAEPGYGKTTLAMLIAGMMGVHMERVVYPLTNHGLCRIIGCNAGSLILLDEIHRAKGPQQEDLLSVLESGFVSTPSGRKMPAIDMMFVSATTKVEKLDAALLDRHPTQPIFDDYTDEDLGLIVRSMAEIAGCDFADEREDPEILGRAAVGIPRRARTMVIALRDLSHAHDRPATAQEVLAFLRLTIDGLTYDHRKYLRTLNATGGQCGMKMLSSLLSKSESVLADTEKLLLKQGLIEPTPQGRTLTAFGFQKIHSWKEAA